MSTTARMPTTEDFRAEILRQLAEAEAQGEASLILVARDIHEKLGGYVTGSKSDHRMAPCSRAMEKLMRPGIDVILAGGPPKNRGANFRVQYQLPHEEPKAPVRMGAAKQHATARQALPIIAAAAIADQRLRYGDLAIKLGRPASHARAVAQVCNLLDSAAALAERPLMALWTVRDRNWAINSEAFVADTLVGLRELVIEEAAAHQFTPADEQAIAAALAGPELRGRGSIAAWQRMQVLKPQQEMLDRLLDREPSPREADNLNDLVDPGSDRPDTVPTSGRRYVRDHQVRLAVLERAEGICEFCKAPGFLKPDGTRYLECHHIIALSAEGKDRRTNVIALCPGHHREAHFGRGRISLESQMVEIVRRKEGVG